MCRWEWNNIEDTIIDSSKLCHGIFMIALLQVSVW